MPSVGWLYQVQSAAVVLLDLVTVAILDDRLEAINNLIPVVLEHLAFPLSALCYTSSATLQVQHVVYGLAQLVEEDQLRQLVHDEACDDALGSLLHDSVSCATLEQEVARNLAIVSGPHDVGPAGRTSARAAAFFLSSSAKRTCGRVSTITDCSTSA